jgi:serine phosphatase RsbU (regulator of sigma subunit)
MSSSENNKGGSRLGSVKRGLLRDLHDLYEFYLDQETRNRLADMGRARRWITVVYWILKSMFFKLTPVRRVLLILSVVLIFNASNGSGLNGGYLLLIFILMLELKDKLLARDELNAGRAVQRALMPDSHPDLEGWDIWVYTHPANEVGGDVVDVLELGPQRMGLTLGDVAGKGLPAALLGAKLQATIRALAPQYDSLSHLGRQLNHIFCRDGLPNRFISLLYMELKAHDNQISLLNAGHLPPLLIKADKILEWQQGSCALGLSESSEYHDELLDIQSGDILIIYSDGLVEARNEEGEFLGEDRFHRQLTAVSQESAREIGEGLLDSVKDFVGDARAHDDLSLLICRRI